MGAAARGGFYPPTFEVLVSVVVGYTVRRVEASESSLVEAARRLLNRELGEEIYPGSSLALTADGGDRSALFAALSLPSESLLGAAVVRILQAGDEGYYERFGDLARRYAIEGAASLEAMAVEPGARRRGIGRALIKARLVFASSLGAGAAVAVSWLSGRDSSLGLFRALGFEESEAVAEFYREESVRDGWVCPVCQGPCGCSAILTAREIGGFAGKPGVRG